MSNEEDNQDGYAAPTPPTTPENIEPPAEVTYSQPAPDPYTQQAVQPSAIQPKKSKLWLWITLAIGIPVLICGIGAVIFGLFLSGEVKSQFDPVNKLYSAARDGESITDYLCEDEKEFGSVEINLEEYKDLNGEIDSFNFKSSDTTNGDTTITGTVTREDGTFDAEVDLVKEDGDYKVCSISER